MWTLYGLTWKRNLQNKKSNSQILKARRKSINTTKESTLFWQKERGPVGLNLILHSNRQPNYVVTQYGIMHLWNQIGILEDQLVEIFEIIPCISGIWKVEKKSRLGKEILCGGVHSTISGDILPCHIFLQRYNRALAGHHYSQPRCFRHI